MGWFALQPPEGQLGPAGAIFLEIRLKDFDSARHLWSFLAPAPPQAAPPPAFDINAVYGPLLHLIDLLWNRMLSPALGFTLDLVFWTRPQRSLFALMVWNVLTMFFLPHLPALLLLALACYVRTQGGSAPQVSAEPKAVLEDTSPSRPTPPCANSDTEASSQQPVSLPSVSLAAGDSGDSRDEAQLSGAVCHLSRALPGWVVELCVFLQPLLRLAADYVQVARDVLNYEHASSPMAVVAILAAALLCEVFSFPCVLAAVGSLVLLVCSPIVTATSGLVAYARWAVSSRGAPSAWEMYPDFDNSWASVDYRPYASVDAAGEHHRAVTRAATWSAPR